MVTPPSLFLNADCRTVIPTLENESIGAIITDPPYGVAMGYAGDATPLGAQSLLRHVLTLAYPKVRRNGYVVIFWSFRHLDMALDAIRAAGYTYRHTLTLYLPRGGARPFLTWLPRTQAIIIAQRYLPMSPPDYHHALAAYLTRALQANNMTRSAVAKSLHCNSRLVMKWTRQNDPAWCLPTPIFYTKLKTLLKLDSQFDELLTRDSTRPAPSTPYHHDLYRVTAPVDPSDPIIHPSQKPLEVVRHIVESLTAPSNGTSLSSPTITSTNQRAANTVLDPFAGSATTLLAALLSGRTFIGTEIDTEFYGRALARLTKHGFAPSETPSCHNAPNLLSQPSGDGRTPHYDPVIITSHVDASRWFADPAPLSHDHPFMAI